MQKLDGCFYKYIDIHQFPQDVRNEILQIENNPFKSYHDQFVMEFKYNLQQSITLELLTASLDKDFLRIRLKLLCQMCHKIINHLQQYKGHINQIHPENIIITFDDKALSIVEEQETDIQFINFVGIIPSNSQIIEYEISEVLYKLAETQIMKQKEQLFEELYEDIKTELKILSNKSNLANISDIYQKLIEILQFLKIDNSQKKRRQYAVPQLVTLNEWLNKFNENIRYHLIQHYVLNFVHFDEMSKKNENISQLLDQDKIQIITKQNIYDKQYSKYIKYLELSIQKSSLIEHYRKHFTIFFNNQNEFDFFKRFLIQKINESVKIEQGEIRFVEIDLNKFIQDFYEQRFLGIIDELF